jgi:hypothetical protein
LEAIFFGPRNNWRELFLEESYFLLKHLRMSYTEVRNLPVNYRKWFIDKVIDDHSKKDDTANVPISEQDNNLDKLQNIANENILLARSVEKSFK